MICRKLFSLLLTVLTLGAGSNASAAELKCGSFLGVHNQWALVQAKAMDYSVESVVRAQLEFAKTDGPLEAKRLSRLSAKAWTLATPKSALGRERRVVVFLQDQSSSTRTKTYATIAQVEDALAFLISKSSNFKGLVVSDFSVGTQSYAISGSVGPVGALNYILVGASKPAGGLLTESRALDLMRLVVTMVQDSGA